MDFSIFSSLLFLFFVYGRQWCFAVYNSKVNSLRSFAFAIEWNIEKLSPALSRVLLCESLFGDVGKSFSHQHKHLYNKTDSEGFLIEAANSINLDAEWHHVPTDPRSLYKV